ncbi:MAG: DNA mismatch endonuclease Vsr [Planctomycetales bacterium]|nr:DNA mismatch endonuclease Vsr [Planctomycetales bacterium]
MADKLSKQQRSKVMSAVRSRDTKPELQVRRLVHGMGYRYRLHGADLPGRPDLVFRPRRKVIFVHGCFWHGHSCGAGARPTSNTKFWNAKIDENVTRDRRNRERLTELDWQYLEIWQCELKQLDVVRERIVQFLEPTN